MLFVKNSLLPITALIFLNSSQLFYVSSSALLRNVLFLSKQKVIKYTKPQHTNLATSAKTGILENEWAVRSSCFGGLLRRIRSSSEGESSTASMPTLAVFPSGDSSKEVVLGRSDQQVQRKGLDAIVPGAFVLTHVLSKEFCEEIIETCETKITFGDYRVGKNHHGAMQIVVSQSMADALFRILIQHMHPQYFDSDMKIPLNDIAMLQHKGHRAIGTNRRWRIYRYEPGEKDAFAAHIDSGFPGSGITLDGKALLWDQYAPDRKNVISRLTILMYLNDDFMGGQTKFYSPVTEGYFPTPNMIAAVKPEPGLTLLFPQAVGEDCEIYACMQWATHEGSPVKHLPEPLTSRPKYVIRSDVLFTRNDDDV